MEKDVKKVYVKFEVEVAPYLPNDMEEIYLCGDKLGSWNPLKAVALKKNKKGVYTANKYFEENTVIQFKVIKTKSWDHVQLGSLCEELENNVFNVNDKTCTVTVYNWKE